MTHEENARATADEINSVVRPYNFTDNEKNQIAAIILRRFPDQTERNTLEGLTKQINNVLSQQWDARPQGCGCREAYGFCGHQPPVPDPHEGDEYGIKYIIFKSDGSLVDEKADYLVLRLDTDEHARAAAMVYAITDDDGWRGELREHLEVSYHTPAPDQTERTYIADANGTGPGSAAEPVPDEPDAAEA